jgi:hypothetical protein
VRKSGTVADYTVADVRAVKSLMAGTASEEQQKRAWDWIINRACAFRSEPYVSASDRDTTYNLGRGAVARMVLHLATLPENIINEMKDDKNG